MPLGPLDEITRTPFEAQTGTPFTLTDGAGNTVEIVLSEVVDSGDRPARWMKRDPFKLWFDVPSGTTIPSNVYSFSHAELGMIGDLLVTPVIDPDNPGVPIYEVIFN